MKIGPMRKVALNRNWSMSIYGVTVPSSQRIVGESTMAFVKFSMGTFRLSSA